jgi:hypothetical protein
MDLSRRFVDLYPELGRAMVRAWTNLEQGRLMQSYGNSDWAYVRARRNRPASFVNVLTVLLFAPNSCASRGQGLSVCYGFPEVQGSLGDVTFDVSGGFTLGSTFYTPEAFGSYRTGDPILKHERRHSDWYAIMGPENFIREYNREYQTYGPCNFLEYAAGFAAGQYSCPGGLA